MFVSSDLICGGVYAKKNVFRFPCRDHAAFFRYNFTINGNHLETAPKGDMDVAPKGHSGHAKGYALGT